MLLESPHFVPGPPEKRELGAATGAIAVDMESAAIAAVAAAHGLPFLAVRTIADPLSMRLPEAVTVALNPRGDVRLGTLLSHVLQNPPEMFELVRLGRAFGAAVTTLRRVRRLSGADCCFASPGVEVPRPH